MFALFEKFSTPMKMLLGAMGLGGMGMAGGGALGIFLFPMLLDYQLAKEMALSPTSETFPKWQEPPIDIFFQVYVFNVTNPELIEYGDKIRVKEVGPYTFKIIYHKTVEKWDDAAGEVHYNLTTTFHFIENMSIGNMKEEVNFFNVPLVVGIAELLTNLPKMFPNPKTLAESAPDISAFVDESFKEVDAKLIERHTIAELLFEGYESKTMQKLFELAASTGQPTPPVDPDRFALLRARNNSVTGPYVAYTGKKGMDKFNWIKSVNNMTELPYWKNYPNYKYCNQINGSDGFMFPPGVKKHQKLYIFSADLCRSLYMQYDKDEDVMHIPTRKFVLGKDVFEDARKCADNVCFCEQDNVQECPTRGIFSLKKCMGIPVYSSNPHFYDTARRHIERIEGMKPEKKKHQLSINVNPVTGLVMRGNKVAQISINISSPALMEPNILPNLTFLTNVSEALLPLIWIHEGAIIDEKNAQEFRDKVLWPINMGYIALISSIAMGTASVLTVTSIMLYYAGKERVDVGTSTEVLHYK